jgi:hypothetical protein
MHDTLTGGHLLTNPEIAISVQLVGSFGRLLRHRLTIIHLNRHCPVVPEIAIFAANDH